MNTKAYDKLNYTMAIVGAAADGKRHGCIVNSFAQVTSSYPAKFVVSVNTEHDTCSAIEAAGSFAVTLLAKDCPKEIVNAFGYKSGRVGDKFAAYEAKEDAAGNPYLTEHMVARISCKVVDKLAIGKYLLFVGDATEAEILSDGQVQTLDDFTGAGAATPPRYSVHWRLIMAGNVRSVATFTRAKRCRTTTSVPSAARRRANL